MHKKNRDKSKVTTVPDIKDGLILYDKAKDSYYMTIIGMSNNLYFTKKNPLDMNELSGMVRKEKLVQWFVDEELKPVEEYDTSFVYSDIESFDDCDNKGDENFE